MDMHVFPPLGINGGLPDEFVTSGRLVIVAQEDSRPARQGQNGANGAIEGRRIAAREIGAGRSVIGHEKRVAHKSRITDHIRDAGGRMAGCVHHTPFERTDVEYLAIREKMIELGAILPEIGLGIENLGEDPLHFRDMCADGDPAAQLLFQIRRRGQMVGMRVGFKYPFDIQLFLVDVSDHFIGRIGRGPSRFRIVVEYGINDGGVVAARLRDDIGHGERGRIEEGFDSRIKAHDTSRDAISVNRPRSLRR